MPFVFVALLFFVTTAVHASCGDLKPQEGKISTLRPNVGGAMEYVQFSDRGQCSGPGEMSLTFRLPDRYVASLLGRVRQEGKIGILIGRPNDFEPKASHSPEAENLNVRLRRADWKEERQVTFNNFHAFSVHNKGNPRWRIQHMADWHDQRYAMFVDEAGDHSLVNRVKQLMFGKPHDSFLCAPRERLSFLPERGCRADLPEISKMTQRSQEPAKVSSRCAKLEADIERMQEDIARVCAIRNPPLREDAPTAYLIVYEVREGAACVRFNLPTAFCDGPFRISIRDLNAPPTDYKVDHHY